MSYSSVVIMATRSSIFLPLTLFITMHFSLSINIFNDQSTLVAFKNHLLTTNPQNNVFASNWSTATSVCSWIGVTCGTRHHRVTALNISDMGLSATVPSLLGNLSFLVSLDMSNNGFHGDLPDELSKLHRLRTIRLRNNTFGGFFPAFLLNISTLETLTLSYNQLQGNLPQQIGNLSHLKVFVASYNEFDGALPNGIGKLKMLEYLYLGDNKFGGEIPEEMSNLYKLKMLDLSDNRLSGSIPSNIFNISTLESIYLNKNNLSGTLPSTMGDNLPNLVDFFLHDNNLTGNIPESISNASKLFTISMQRNGFTGPIPVSFGNLKQLDCLHLYSNGLTNGASNNQELSFITSLTKCPKLRDVSVSDNPLDGFLPASIGNLSTHVIRFYASGCRIKGHIPDEIGNLSHVLNLVLNNNSLSGSIPNTFRSSQKLQGLLLGNNRIRGGIASSICQLPGLNTLGLRLNQISGPIPECIGNLTSLREVYLGSNGLTSNIPSTLWNLLDLRVLSLSSNSFTGNLPQLLQNLKVATSIDLSGNEFTGLIPDAYGDLQNLITFSLGNNRLQGSIPDFGRMISLERLDLSNNGLSGEIPKTLLGLASLKYLNVSFNRLRGEIPNEGPFKNFTSDSFESNEALCGDPRLGVPLCRSSSSNRIRRWIVIVSVITGSSLILMTIFVVSWIMRRSRRAEASGETDPEFQSSTAERFSYKQIQQATDGFSEANLLGRGSFGCVYRASFPKGVVLAVKVFNLEQENAAKSFETECEMLSKLRHRNLTKVISSCSNLEFKALLLEYMHHGSLDKWLHSDSYYLDMKQRLDIMIDVASALEYLHHGYHHRPVIHCDLKPSNVLLDKDMVGHVTDFGITKLLGEEDESNVQTQTLATLGYMAPEYGSGGMVSSACDVYSYGIVLMETFTRRRPSDETFRGESSLRSWIYASLPNSIDGVVDSELITEEDEHFNEKMECVSSIMELAMDCSVKSPRKRMNMKDVLIALNKIKLQFSDNL